MPIPAVKNLKPYAATVYRRKKCPMCDVAEAGLNERLDHGCLSGIEVGRGIDTGNRLNTLTTTRR